MWLPSPQFILQRSRNTLELLPLSQPQGITLKGMISTLAFGRLHRFHPVRWQQQIWEWANNLMSSGACQVNPVQPEGEDPLANPCKLEKVSLPYLNQTNLQTHSLVLPAFPGYSCWMPSSLSSLGQSFIFKFSERMSTHPCRFFSIPNVLCTQLSGPIPLLLGQWFVACLSTITAGQDRAPLCWFKTVASGLQVSVQSCYPFLGVLAFLSFSFLAVKMRIITTSKVTY